MALYVGDDWAEDHHDVHLMDETGNRPERPRPAASEEVVLFRKCAPIHVLP